MLFWGAVIIQHILYRHILQSMLVFLNKMYLNGTYFDTQEMYAHVLGFI